MHDLTWYEQRNTIPDRSTPMVTTLPWPPPLWKTPDPDVPGRMRRLLTALDNPHKRLPPVVHIAGTTGKTSVIAFLRAMCEAADKEVHIFSGPHLRRYNERIQLAGREVKEAVLADALERCRRAAGEEAYTLQEGLTAAALLLCAETPADLLLLESQHGGLVDPSNCIEQVRLSILTSISYGLTPVLGEHLQDIAAHHLGILRQGVPCISSIQAQPVAEELETLAEPLDITLYRFGKEWKIQRSEEGVRYVDKLADATWELPAPTMLGDHQILNAGVAITAAQYLSNDFELEPEHIAAGYMRAWLPGRLEHVRQGKLAKLLPQDWELWFDAASTPAALFALRQMAERDWRDKPLYLIYGASKATQRLDDISAGLAAFRQKAAMVQAVPVPDDPQSATAEEIAAAAREAGLQVQEAFNIEYALSNLRRIAADEPIRVLLVGSLRFATCLK